MTVTPATLPDFAIIGAGKAGTTWLHVQMSAHPGIAMPAHKEPHYFSANYHRGDAWYRGRFPRDLVGRRSGDCSPSYLHVPAVPLRLRAANPDVRLIALLRDPVARAYSDYCMRLNAAAADPDPTAELVPGSPIVEVGRYHTHLSRFLDAFSQERLLVLLHEDVASNPSGLLRACFAHVRVSPDFVPAGAEVPVFERRPRKRYPRLHRLAAQGTSMLSAWSPTFARWLSAGQRGGRFSWYHSIARGGDYPPLPDATRLRLIEYYEPEVRAIERLLNRDLSHWRTNRPGV